MTVHDTFTCTCPWGCTINVEEGVEQPHTCRGTGLILDSLHDAHHGRGNLSMLQLAEHVARQLDPEVRVLKADSWETGVHDGRSGGKFYGIDDDDPADQTASNEEAGE